jgi:DNA segregation ATPase FtsK/SpoIIIE, S-DNA-T family
VSRSRSVFRSAHPRRPLGGGGRHPWRGYGLLVLAGAVLGAVLLDSPRVFPWLLVTGAVAPLAAAGWWAAVRVAAERVPAQWADVFGLLHAWRSWPELATHVGLATIDPNTARQLVPVRGGPGALVLDPGSSEWIVPRLRFRLSPWGFRGRARLVAGLVPEDFAARVPALTHAWYAHAIRVDSPRRGWVSLTVLRRDPLSTPVPALPVPDAPDPYGLPVGRCEDGRTWLLRLLGRHILIAGSTGAGKGSVQWSILRAICPLIHSRLVEVWTADPKRMEFPAGRPLFARYATDPERIVVLAEDAAVLLDERAGRLAGLTRQHQPTPGEPLIVLNLDEIAFLTAYLPDRKLRERFGQALARILTQGRAVGVLVMAAVQDPRKDVLTWRNLFPTRVALRLDDESQVDMVLGDGALERGAACHLISPDEHAGAGTGYVLEEGHPWPVRVRAGHITDNDITAMTQRWRPVQAADPAN